MISPTAFMLAGLALAYLVGGLAGLGTVAFALATVSIAVPTALRELGLLRDHDELQLRAQRRGALWAFVLILVMAPVVAAVPDQRDAIAGRGLEAAISLFALIYLVDTQGAGRGVRSLLLVGSGLSLAFGLSHLPDLDKLAAMTVVAAGFAALGWLAARAPRPAGVVILILTVARAVFLWQQVHPDRIVLVPTTILSLAVATVLLRAPRDLAAP